MTEIIFVLAATAIVFGVFLLVFLLKGNADTGPVKIHTCADCDCQRDGRQHRRSIEHLKMRSREEKNND